MKRSYPIRLAACFVVLTLIYGLSTKCHAQNSESFYFGIGATNTINGKNPITDNLGYYAALGVTNMLGGKFGYQGEVSVIYQSSKPAQINTANALFMFKYRPGKLNFGAGFQIGLALSDNRLNEYKEKQKGQGGAGVIHLGYQVFKRFEVQARYNHYIEKSVINQLTQIGVNYKLK